jgi:hypothetical protein
VIERPLDPARVLGAGDVEERPNRSRDRDTVQLGEVVGLEKAGLVDLREM